MPLLDQDPIDPEIAATLDAIDATLAGEPVDGRYAEIAEIALLLAVRPAGRSAGVCAVAGRQGRAAVRAAGRSGEATEAEAGRAPGRRQAGSLPAWRRSWRSRSWRAAAVAGASSASSSSGSESATSAASSAASSPPAASASGSSAAVPLGCGAGAPAQRTAKSLSSAGAAASSSGSVASGTASTPSGSVVPPPLLKRCSRPRRAGRSSRARSST